MPSTPGSGNASAIPRPSQLYWICQFAGWSGYLAYVLGGYFLFASQRHASDVVSIVFFCLIVPPLMTHGLRAWMYVNNWTRLSAFERGWRSFAAVVIFAGTVTAAVGVVNGLAHGRLWAPLQGMFWMFVAYLWAFGGWRFIYVAVHERRRRDELEMVARDAQLGSLRAQLNPHFLFNCLNSVRSLIVENPQGASAMVTGLAEILRYSLASDRQDTVSMSEELHVVGEYVSLERVRFEERLRFEQSVEPAALDVRVPPMLVQTLVENAVKHGISALQGGGFVRLDVRVRGDVAEIEVTNSGPFKPPANASGYGLRNATERLRLLWGDAASLTIRENDGITVAALTIPRTSVT